MITDKEYPAPHSMATAWYMVDDDGNVGLISFNDRGPVPHNLVYSPDYSAGCLQLGEGFQKRETPGAIRLTDEQLLEILGVPHTPEEEIENFWANYYIRIDMSREKKFLDICRSEDCDRTICVSKTLGIYYTHFKDSCFTHKDLSIKKRSSLGRLLQSKLILAVYNNPQHFTVDMCHCIEDGPLLETICNSASPYYMYAEPYFPCYLQRRVNIPKRPVKISQIKERFRNKVLHIPGRFADMETIQIARWHFSAVKKREYTFNGATYAKLPISETEWAFVLVRPFVVDFFEYCPQKDTYGCTRCDNCLMLGRHDMVPTPTILCIWNPSSIKTPKTLHSALKEISDKIAELSYIPKFPYREDIPVSLLLKEMTQPRLYDILSKSKGWFEKTVDYIMPHAILIDDDAAHVLQKVFPYKNKTLLINGIRFPAFLFSEAEKNIALITRLAQKPFVGKVPYIISIDEMEKHLADGSAHRETLWDD